ncbi:glycosyltransferase [Muricauda sp. 2012CJ35-5]|uniref:Glycosyltransferase n=1 Tax=Flagellimonas spongiicola TaxID=2942208 RepID=A0ABT0PX45_9FLAO|nr:glycosyltransferase [Allomuricauda spongiicola]MCL6275531.1 glycosyltransferase [Allomuricauda spongiicola]
MRFSILIPLYNKEKYIDRCLKSLLDQNLSEDTYEIVIVDDGSKDSGPKIAQEFAEKHTNIHLISQKNQGPSAARNRALEAAKGEYLYFLDADDYLAKNILEPLLNIATDNNLDILEFNTIQIENGKVPEIRSQNIEALEINIKDGITYVADHGFRNEAWRYIVKREFLETSGIKFIEGTLYEDAIFTASLFLKAEAAAKIDLDVHRYVVVENSIVTSTDKAHNLKFIKGMVYAIEIFRDLMGKMDSAHPGYGKAVKRLKARQQSFVFALIIRTLKFRLMSFKELKEILTKLNSLEAYPIDPKVGGIGNSKNRKLYNATVVPIFNNKTLLFLGIGIMRLKP